MGQNDNQNRNQNQQNQGGHKSDAEVAELTARRFAEESAAKSEALAQERAKKAAEEARVVRDARAKAAQARREADAAKIFVQIVHGKYVDHDTYTTDDEDKPPALPGDFVEVSVRESRRLIASGIAVAAA